MNTLDIIVFAVIAISGLLAFIRGFVREVLAIGAWVGAIFAAIYLTQPTLPIFHQIISAAWLADIVAPIVVFVVALLILSMLTGMVTTRVRNSGLGAADRGLGLVFGVLRGFIIVCLAYLALNYMVPPNSRPAWIAQARSLPLLARGADTMASFVPKSAMNEAVDQLQNAQKKAEAMRQIQKGYDTLNEPSKKSQDNGTSGNGNGTGTGNGAGGTTTPPKPGNGASNSATPSGDYSDADRNGMNQLMKGAQ